MSSGRAGRVLTVRIVGGLVCVPLLIFPNMKIFLFSSFIGRAPWNKTIIFNIFTILNNYKIIPKKREKFKKIENMRNSSDFCVLGQNAVLLVFDHAFDEFKQLHNRLLHCSKSNLSK